MYFSFLENETDIELFRKSSRNEEARSRAPGLASMSNIAIGVGWGSWVSWNGNELRWYVSHDLATQMILNLNICAVVTGVVGIVCAVFGNLACGAGAELMALGCVLTSSAIQYWDDLGAPGFYICATASPPRAWIEP